MRRNDRRRRERQLRGLTIVGLSFALGALTAGGLEWRLDADHPSGSAAPAVSATAEEIAALEAGRTEPAVEPVPAGTTGASASRAADGDAVEELEDRDLLMPVEGIDEDDLHDTFDDARGSRRHHALDIMAPRHTPVRAVENGRIAKLFSSKAGGLSIYMFDPSERFCYYYAHLDRYAAGLKEGQAVQRGQLIGYVGSTGNAAENAPHLHFAIFRLGPERQWWKGEPINPYPILR